MVLNGVLELLCCELLFHETYSMYQRVRHPISCFKMKKLKNIQKYFAEETRYSQYVLTEVWDFVQKAHSQIYVIKRQKSYHFSMGSSEISTIWMQYELALSYMLIAVWYPFPTTTNGAVARALDLFPIVEKGVGPWKSSSFRQ